MKIIISKSVKDTKEIAKDIARALRAGDILALVGDLGGGKTHFAKGIAEYLGILDDIQSPTFTFINEYNLKKKSLKKFYHMDMYRLESEKEALELGLIEIFQDKEAIFVVEWADMIPNTLPKKAQFIEFEFVDDNTRRIKIR